MPHPLSSSLFFKAARPLGAIRKGTRGYGPVAPPFLAFLDCFDYLIKKSRICLIYKDENSFAAHLPIPKYSRRSPARAASTAARTRFLCLNVASRHTRQIAVSSVRHGRSSWNSKKQVGSRVPLSNLTRTPQAVYSL